ALDKYIPHLMQQGVSAEDIAQLEIGDGDLQAFLSMHGPQQAPGKPFTLNPGDVRFDGQNNPVASNPKAAASPSYKTVQVGDKMMAFDPTNPTAGLVELGPAPQKSPLVQVDTGDNGPRVGTIPQGMQLIQDPEGGGFRMEAIPGSAQAREQEQGAIKAAANQRVSDEQFNIMNRSIDRALEQADAFSAGLMGQATQGIGSTPARNLRATLDTIVANIGFDKLQEMRETSPTGGALGQVTERELAFLQAVRGSLDQAQDPAQLRQSLGEIKQSLANLQEVRRIAATLNMQNTGDNAPQSGGLTPEEQAELEALRAELGAP
ncbi:MAG: hypothetical protein AAFQ67_02745, partial [Pseudomonadota bacterium]